MEPRVDGDPLDTANHLSELQDLASFLLDALPADERDRTRGHLMVCSRCQLARVELDRLIGLCGAVPGEVFGSGPPARAEDLVVEVLRRIDAQGDSCPDDGPASDGITTDNDLGSAWFALPGALGRPENA